MATPKFTTPTLPPGDRETAPERELLSVWRRLAPTERAKVLHLVVEIERAACRQPERLRVH
jgi:hypothetical protein